MKTEISKSEFKDKVLEVLRSVEDSGQSVLITDSGIPTIEIRRYREQLRDAKKILRGSVLSYVNPTRPAGEQWEALV